MDAVPIEASRLEACFAGRMDIQDGSGRQLRESGGHSRHQEAVLAAPTEMSRYHAMALARELRMVELKCEINALCARLGEPPRYRIAVPAPLPEERS